MDIELPAALISASIVTYWIRTSVIAFGAWRERRTTTRVLPSSELPFVSIIIPARNEEHRIKRCLESLISVDYPPSKLEIIVVNDRSTDRTGEVIAAYADRIPSLRVLTLHHPRTGNLQGKAGALDAGIAHAQGEIILLTDADCAVHPQWVRSHVSLYSDPDVVMVCGYTLIDGQRLFDRYQAVEWNATHTMASAGVHYRQYLGCYGNNMSIRRRVYQQLGGYAAIPFSVTEDLALLQAVGNTGKTIRYLCSQQSTVVTEPCRTIAEYLQQHQRWVHGARALRWRAYLFVATTVIYWLGLLTALVRAEWVWVAGILGARMGADVLLNAPALMLLNRKHLIAWIIPTTVLFSMLELTLPLLALSRSIEWKDQVFITVPSRPRTASSP
ncbi:MAG: glycosyltransferase [Chlorobi bacterium]|nr:glycosyltransferase [Chlorobiota bacterium]